MMDDPREKRLKQMQKDYPFTPARDDLITDEIRARAGLGPLPRSATQGVEDMRQRLEILIDYITGRGTAWASEPEIS